MKLSFITPTKFIRKFGSQSDFILALSHLIDKDTINEYELEIRTTKLPIILDNGLFENHVPEPIETLLEKAKRIKATHFFAPDILFNSEETQKELERTIALVKEKGITNIGIAAVVQADNSEDYMKQLRDFNANPDVHLIGLSILSIPKSFEKDIGKFDITESRRHLLELMRETAQNEGVKWKSCHLLGLGDSYRDVEEAAEFYPWVVSNDTSCCFQSGLYGKRLADDLAVPGGKVHEKVNFELSEISEAQEEIIQHNIDQVKKIICK